MQVTQVELALKTFLHSHLQLVQGPLWSLGHVPCPGLAGQSPLNGLTNRSSALPQKESASRLKPDLVVLELRQHLFDAAVPQWLQQCPGPPGLIVFGYPFQL
jgi:hypothetical protein